MLQCMLYGRKLNKDVTLHVIKHHDITKRNNYSGVLSGPPLGKVPLWIDFHKRPRPPVRDH